jgi:hypothetical protein
MRALFSCVSRDVDYMGSRRRPRRQGDRAAGVNFRRVLRYSLPFRTMANARKNKAVAGNKPAVPATNAGENVSTETKQGPVRTIREGDCSASVWARHVTVKGEQRVFYSVTLERSYKDRTGQYRYTKTFDSDSLPKVAVLCSKAQGAIQELQRFND